MALGFTRVVNPEVTTAEGNKGEVACKVKGPTKSWPGKLNTPVAGSESISARMMLEGAPVAV